MTEPSHTNGWWSRFYARLGRLQVVGFGAGLLAGLLVAIVLSPPREQEAGIEPGELVIMIDRDQSVGGQRERLIREWEAVTQDSQLHLPEHERTTVRIIELPDSATAAHSQLVAQAQSGGGGVDIYNLDVTWVAEFVREGWLRALSRSTIDETTFLEEPLAAGRRDDRLWALPFNADAPLLYYNKDLVAEEPVTWDDLIDAWDRLRETEDPPAAGYAGQLADYEGFTVNVLEAVLFHDPHALDGDRWVRGGDAWTSGLMRLADGLASGFILPESLRYDEGDSLEAFRSQQVPFMRNWPVAYRRLTTQEPGAGAPSSESEWVRPADVGVTLLPGTGEAPAPGVLGGQSLAIASGTAKPRAAQRLIEFLTSPRSQETLFVKGGFVPTQKVVYESLQGMPEYAYLGDVRRAVEQARQRPVHPRYELVSETIRRLLHRYLTEAVQADAPADPTEVMAQLADELAAASVGFRR